MSKTYKASTFYEKKLEKVMERFNITKDDYLYNWDRFGCWVQFKYKGEMYRFDHSVENAKQHGHEINYGSDSFAQLILALEDLARIAERGIYDIQKWIVGMRYLPAPDLPSFFRALGFSEMPTIEDVKKKYKMLARKLHPDAGGTSEDFNTLQNAYEKCLGYLSEKNE